ncbi:MAG: 50S ribosomal protein L13 [Candidatus Moranbacteria bacterium RBG_13_45_13]|nr:MAG: 50S ribosomal protein L13 [Candidatus Moranbacteria bacterium RBG_13_45_13]
MKRKYYSIDCRKFTLGRLATRAAFLLQGKHEAGYKPNEEKGDFVAVMNSDEVQVTGRKKEKKIYHSFSGYPGGISSRNLKEELEIDSRKVIRNAVYGMLPKNKLRDIKIKRLLVFKDANHDIKLPLTEINES